MHEDDLVHEAALVNDPCPSSDVLVDEVHGNENKVPFFLSICLILFYLFVHFITMWPFVMTFYFCCRMMMLVLLQRMLQTSPC